MRGNLPPARGIARTRACHGAIHNAVLQRARHFRERYVHALRAQLFKEQRRHPARRADLQALQIGKAVDLGVAEHDLRRIGRDGEDLGVEPVAEDLLNHGARRIDHGARFIGGQRQKWHVEAFQLGRVAHGVIGHGHSDVINPLPQQRINLRQAKAHLVVRGQLHVEIARTRQRFGPERRLILVVQRQRRPASDNVEIFGLRRAHQSGGSGKCGECLFHGISSCWVVYCRQSSVVSASSATSEISMWPGEWVMQSGSFACKRTFCGVTPQAQ